MDLASLLALTLAAAGPDRDLDCALAVMLDGFEIHRREWRDEDLYCKVDDDGCLNMPGQGADMLVPEYSGSMDDVLAFAERLFPGCWYTFGRGRTRPDEPLYGAILVTPEIDGAEPFGEGEHEASTQLAIIVALLDAKSRPVQDAEAAAAMRGTS